MFFVANSEFLFYNPGADITDYFNYGFTEDTWRLYCEKQRKMRQEVNQLNKLVVRPSSPPTVSLSSTHHPHTLALLIIVLYHYNDVIGKVSSIVYNVDHDNLLSWLHLSVFNETNYLIIFGVG